MVIRSERSSDQAAIRGVLTSAFPTDLEARLVEALRSAGNLTYSLVAEVDSQVVGHIALSPTTCANTSDGMGLGPLAVLPSHQCRGIGGQLVHAALDAFRADGGGFVVVLGEPAYYGRFGFEAAVSHGLHDEYGGGSAFQVIELRRGAIPRGAGRVHYAPEFAAIIGSTSTKPPTEQAFTIDDQLLTDCHRLGRVGATHLLLHKNSLLPWFILVPETAQTNLLKLPPDELQAVLENCQCVSRFLESHLGIEHVNVASLGNVVSQLHVHVVGRRVGDPCWPKPVWGNLHEFRPYDETQVREWTEDLVDFCGLVVFNAGAA